MSTNFFLVTFLVAVSSQLFAQPEILDNTFGSYGTLTTDFGAFDEGVHSVAVQSDGKIVVAGWFTINLDRDFALARYNTNGTLDSSFSMDGKVLTSLGGWDEARSVVIQEDGKIVAAGFSNTGCPDYQFALARYNTDGSLDTGFGTNGKLTTSFNTPWAEAHSVIIQSDGKIVAAGLSAFNVTNQDFALARFNTDGTLDNSFGSDGRLTTDFDSAYDIANSVILQDDGKIVVAGSSYDGTNGVFALARYNNDGTVDSTFGTGGKLTTAFKNSDAASSIALQSDNKIVAVGYAGVSDFPDYADFALDRYNADGTLDSTFDTDGKITTAISLHNNEFATSVVIQGDGKIVVGGYSPTPNFEFTLVRYNLDGTLDTTFSPGGILITNIGLGDQMANSMALQTDGKIVAAGYLSCNTGYDFALARYTTEFAVGVPELSQPVGSLFIYPNPSTGVIEVQSSSSPIQTTEAFNLLGEKVFSTSTLLHSNSIDLSSQPDGVYFLHLKTAEGMVVKKVLISR